MQDSPNSLHLPHLMKGNTFLGSSCHVFASRHPIIPKIITALALVYAVIMLTDNETLKTLKINDESNLDQELYCRWSDNIE
ncbi:unnamed protein product [Hymenolepis diminuta]|uniref:Uncharacterized protein n=1 Tax=Hymenolepis diminuta TaxID=6216 RepID=A0A0R3SXX2_HYMDI|nr:unnamed protein product [Hymenolepis diminuta]